MRSATNPAMERADLMLHVAFRLSEEDCSRFVLDSSWVKSVPHEQGRVQWPDPHEDEGVQMAAVLVLTLVQPFV